jgi:hypothetical protein
MISVCTKVTIYVLKALFNCSLDSFSSRRGYFKLNAVCENVEIMSRKTLYPYILAYQTTMQWFVKFSFLDPIIAISVEIVDLNLKSHHILN